MKMSDGERAARAGGYVDIGAECFGLADGSVLCWRGQNYVPQKPTLRVRFHNWRVQRVPDHHGMAPCWHQPGKQGWHLACALEHPLRFLRSRGPRRWRPGA